MHLISTTDKGEMSASGHGGRTPKKTPPTSTGLETWRDPEQVTMLWR